ncbi:MAG: winged helix-turn-helix transcriptional regulator [Candidatus Omnitrophica bacterium]|nr:winged helix-turn-helix transcriptional regulator [Candidatus Omnitrophota bacterium]
MADGTVRVRHECEKKDYYEVPLEALREAVANAIIHRDYNIRGTSVMIEVHEDRVMIKNPGGFPAGMTQEKLGDLSVRRNELIADIFARMHRVERMGSGFKRIRESMESAGLPFPKISSNGFFFIEFERPKKGVGKTEDGKEKSREKGKEKSREKILNLITRNPNVTTQEIADSVGLSIAGIEKAIRILKKEGRLKRIGPDKGGHWEAVK